MADEHTHPEGFRIPFAAGHTPRMPRLTNGPFRYRRYADSFLETAQRFATVLVKQAVIAPSALSLMCPDLGIPGYSRDEFMDECIADTVGLSIMGRPRHEDRSTTAAV